MTGPSAALGMTRQRRFAGRSGHFLNTPVTVTVYTLYIKAMPRSRCLFPILLIGLFLMLPGAVFGQQCIEDVFCVIADEHEGVVDFYVDNNQADDLIVIFDVDTQNTSSMHCCPKARARLGIDRSAAQAMARVRCASS